MQGSTVAWAGLLGHYYLPSARALPIPARPSTLFGITLANLVLTIVTLGIYLFWGKVKARK